MSWFKRPPAPTSREHFVGDAVVDEHFVPRIGLQLEDYARSGDLTGAHHLVRYLWAAEHLRDTRPVRLLDLGCGSGYGSFLLAQALPESAILGVDYDPGAIAQASAAYSRANLSFKRSDPLRWEETIGGDRFDTVVCFDVLEHVEHREIMMEELARHVDDGGEVLLSTPCGRESNDLKPGWEHHRIEYAVSSLYDFLARYFRELVGSDRDGFPHREVFTRLHEMGIDYLLLLNPVICRGPIRVPNPYRRG